MRPRYAPPPLGLGLGVSVATVAATMLTVVGALRVDDDAARRFGFRGGGGGAPAPAAPSRTPDNLMLHPRLRRPAEPRNCCEKLVAAVFSW